MAELTVALQFLIAIFPHNFWQRCYAFVECKNERGRGGEKPGKGDAEPWSRGCWAVEPHRAKAMAQNEWSEPN